MLRADPINSAHLAPVQPLKISLPQSSQCSGAAQPPQLCLYFCCSPPPSLPHSLFSQIFTNPGFFFFAAAAASFKSAAEFHHKGRRAVMISFLGPAVVQKRIPTCPKANVTKRCLIRRPQYQSAGPHSTFDGERRMKNTTTGR